MPKTSTAAQVPPLWIGLLGGFHVAVGHATIPDRAWGLRRARTLVKLLALEPHHRLHREQIVDTLWRERTPGNPGNSLHQVAHAARQALESAVAGAGRILAFQDDHLALDTPAPLTDVEAFEMAAAHARQDGSVSAYRVATDLYTGELLPEDRYEDWAIPRREHLCEQFTRLTVELARLLEEQEAYPDAIAALQRVVQADAAHEEAQVRLMRLHALRGSIRDARRQYEMLVTALADIGAHPQPASERLYSDIQSGRFPGPSLPRAASAFTLVPAAASKPASTNLPTQMNRFIGRSREIVEVSSLLAGSRALTIAGTGGSGKTRLALQAAGSLVERFGDGVWLVELAALGQPSLLPQAVASALRVPERVGESVTETLAAVLESKHLLLVLDNCEHLIDACSRLAETLLRRCPQVRLLCTSREPLHIAGEVVWRISSLTLPGSRQPTDLASLPRCESVELFLDRARATRPSFTLTAENAPSIVQICRRLDGLPLAIELAAALVSVLSVEQIAARLDDSFRLLASGSRTALTRHQTLRGALDWSYHLLNEPERTLFRRLAVFVGGFDLAAAEAMADPGDSPATDTLALLSRLVEKSLVIADTSGKQAHYRLLEPVRQYAERQLAETGETQRAHGLHAAWFSQVSERVDRELWESGHEAALAWLDANRDNLRAALAWRLRDGTDAAIGLRHALALWQFWLLRGAFAEGRSWMERLLHLAPEPSVPRAEILMRVIGIAIRRGTFGSEQARTAANECVATYRALGDATGISRALQMRGVQAYMAGHFDAAEAAFGESLAHAQGLGLAWVEGLTEHGLGVLEWARGNLARARDCFQRSLELWRTPQQAPQTAIVLLNIPLLPFAARSSAWEVVNEETWVLLRTLDAGSAIGYCLAHLGSLARTEGAHAAARAHLEDARGIFERHGDRAGLAQVQGQLGNLARVEGDFAHAGAMLRESLRLRRALGDRRGILVSLNNLGLLAVAEGEYARAEALYSRTLRWFAALGDGSGVQMTLELRAHLAVVRGDLAQAYTLYAEVLERVRSQVGGLQDVAFIQANLGATALRQRELALAREHLTHSLALYERLRHTLHTTLLGETLRELSLPASTAGPPSGDPAKSFISRP